MRAVAHIGLSGLFLTEHAAGVGTYAWRLACALGEARPDWRFTVFTGRGVRPPLALPANVRLETTPVPASSWSARCVWEQVGLARQARRGGVELLHSLNGSGPARTTMPHVVTIHDVIFESWPADYPVLRRTLISALFRRTARAADRVLAVSEAAAAEIAAAYDLAPGHLRVTLNGPGSPVHPATAADREALRARHGLDPAVPLVLTVGGAHHYKNLDGLVRAAARLRDDGVTAQWLVVGSLGDLADDLRQLASELRAPVRWHGWAAEPELEAAYAEATLVALPSRAEGFGLPLLEAFARGRATVASRIPVFEEVAGDGALLADSRDPAAFAAAVAGLLGDADGRDQLARRGAERLHAFSWKRTARETLAVYDELLA